MPTTYSDWLMALLPPPLAGRWGKALAGTIGGGINELLPLAKLAAKTALVADAPDDALAYHGRDRGLPQAPGESIDAHRARLAAAWESWRWAGSERAIRDALVLAQLGDAKLYAQRELPMPPRTTWWSRFTVVFSGRAIWDGSLPWDDDLGLWDGRLVAPIEALTDAEARALLRAVIRPWKCARDRVTAVIVARGSLLWDEGDAWDQPIAWDGGDTPTELSSEPWDDVAPWDDPSAGVYDYLL